MLRLRVPLALVAVFVVVALVVGVLIGGRVIHDWNALNNSAPAGGSDESQVAQLEAIPLHIPVFQSHAGCQTGPYNSSGSYGSGPVYGDGGGVTSSSDWGLYYTNSAYTETSVAGPILVRALDIFTRQPVIFIGQYAAGPAAVSDTVNGRVYDQHLELVLNTSTSDKPARWVFRAGVPKSWSGSTGWQIDGIGFSEVFLVC